VEPNDAEALAKAQGQLERFAKDFNEMIARERTRREEVESALREVKRSYMMMVQTLAMVCEAKDSYTRQHLDRTYQYAIALTNRIAPELARDAAIGYGYLLHDIGKIGVPESILLKPGPLDDDEWRVMRTHPLIGLQIVTPIRFLGEAAQVIRSHHERWDGKGYPEGIAGEDIYLPARIFSVVDTFDAMTSDRPYRARLPVHVALEEIDRHAGTQFDPEVAAAFVAMTEELELKGGEPESLTVVP